jgi:hypothetical protein
LINKSDISLFCFAKAFFATGITIILQERSIRLLVLLKAMMMDDENQ